MGVTPMDLQVLFMQEPAAAKEADKRRRKEEARKTRLGNLARYRSHNPEVEATEESAVPEEVSDEGGGGRRRYRHREQEEESEEEQPQEEGKGDVMDFEA